MSDNRSHLYYKEFWITRNFTSKLSRVHVDIVIDGCLSLLNILNIVEFAEEITTVGR